MQKHLEQLLGQHSLVLVSCCNMESFFFLVFGAD